VVVDEAGQTSTAGSPRALIRRTCKRRKRC
jgi:hypothetical protein